MKRRTFFNEVGRLLAAMAGASTVGLATQKPAREYPPLIAGESLPTPRLIFQIEVRGNLTAQDQIVILRALRDTHRLQRSIDLVRA